MGLLDSLKFSTGDPEKDAQLNRGLLQMGLQLMQSRGRLFPALGQAGMVGLQAADQTRQMQQQQRESEQMRQMRQLQIGQAQRQAQIEALPGQFYRAPSSPAMDATGGMDTAVEAPNNASGPGGFDVHGYLQALRGMDFAKAMQLEAMMAKPAVQPVVSKPGDVARDPKTGAILWQNPQEAKPGEESPLAKLVREMAALPPDSPMRKVYEDAIKKATTHQPAAVMNNFGSPVAGTDPTTGAPAFAVTDKQGNVKVLKAIAPPGKDMTEGQAKANLFGTRAKESDAIIGRLASSGVIAPSLPQQATGGEGMAGALATAFATPEQQQVDQAQRDFINAVLRRESGAVIAPSEFANARKQYFPMPGDSPGVIAQKARNRQVAIQGILAEVPETKRGVPASQGGNDDPLGLRK